MKTELAGALEKPRNGLAGLKHWRHDLLAGLLVSLISLPFSLGIAVASGAPPIAGLLSAIIAGLILPFLGGSYVTVSGPAAGLAPALLVAMTVLGRGNLAVGYPLLLGAICLTGAVQVVLSKMKAARFCTFFPSVVVEGMLASIGLMIIAKQLPHLIGHEFKFHEFFSMLAETPSQLRQTEPKVFLLGMVCLALVFLLGALKARWLKVVPPQVLVVVIGIILARLLHLDSRFLIHIPDDPFKHGIVLPNFQGLLADRTLWLAVVTTVVTLTLIDGVESLATIAAIDRIDPFRRKSDPDRTLFAMGVSNICSSMAGGLTIIPGGVKSTACIQGGGRTQWANFYNACFLLIFLFAGRGLINLIPFSTLAAILIFTGYKLCRPSVWRHTAAIGSEQLLIFGTTVIATLATDLLWGIIIGTSAKMLMTIVFELRAGGLPIRAATPLGVAVGTLGGIADLFRNPVVDRELIDGGYHLYLGRPLVCFNTLQLSKELENIPSEAENVYLHIEDGVSIIDHTSCDNLTYFTEEFESQGKRKLEVLGMDRMRMRSDHPSCMRLGVPALAVASGEGPCLLEAVEDLGVQMGEID
ncbi:SulP family inorganic anion transporter [Singulisphaera acidiphila]|uniref:Sulfate permease-like transporter, MFS superfamily n=1 Tax=Singulisphaera acidiphila (strain ATCC BAA-1392 / DSM 18658 / VKM B-2454 / MOB10) TaxID=886293 RepID=L0DEM0_SINAD|nr:SulP family inorganic anion transporter [Singulisphaera acidiphila]AGA27819.1 sulfate permease-like transporter, MFS superfamily [Singulisphaera acidiphila DSM 18658]